MYEHSLYILSFPIPWAPLSSWTLYIISFPRHLYEHCTSFHFLNICMNTIAFPFPAICMNTVHHLLSLPSVWALYIISFPIPWAQPSVWTLFVYHFLSPPSVWTLYIISFPRHLYEHCTSFPFPAICMDTVHHFLSDTFGPTIFPPSLSLSFRSYLQQNYVNTSLKPDIAMQLLDSILFQASILACVE